MDRRDNTTKNSRDSWTAQMLAKHGPNPHIRHEDDEEDD